MNLEVLDEARAAGATLAGSLLAAPPASRLAVARRLVEAGAWLHADLIDGTYPLGRGVEVELVNELVARYPDRVDVHVMGAPALLDGLAGRPARVTVHARDEADARALLARVAGRAPELWLSLEVRHWSAASLAAVFAGDPADGVLVMLTPPGDPRHRADLSAADSDVWRRARATGPLGVDGGVRARDISPLAARGAGYVVVGRDLLDHETAVDGGTA